MEALNNKEISSDQTNSISRPTDSSVQVAKKIKRKPNVSLRLLDGILGVKVAGKEEAAVSTHGALDPVLLEAMDEFDYIIENDACSVVDFWDTLGHSLLTKAVKLDLLDLVYSLLKHAEASLFIPDLSKLFFLACEMNHLELVKVLLMRGADIYEWRKDYDGWATCLHIASRHEHLLLMRLLIEYGASVNAIHSGNDSPLTDAVVFGNLEAVRLLLDQGADVDLIDSEFKDIGYGPALSCACAYDYAKVAELLLDHGADINFTNLDGNTPLLLALNNLKA